MERVRTMAGGSAPDEDYVPRLVDGVVDTLLAELPAVQLVGPRAAGKTTTALRHAASVVRLDRPAEAAVFRADPDVALRGLAEPVLLDEWQVVPEVLPAVKRSVDADGRAGRFIVTGSVRATLEAPTWAGTGRVVTVALQPLVEREVVGRSAQRSLFDRLVEDDVPTAAESPPDLGDYVELAVRGGFPDVVRRPSPVARRRWLDSYVEQLVTRDAELVDGGRDPDRLGRYLEAVAANTAGVVEHKRLYDAAGITRVTATAYDQLLRNLYVIDAVPAWSSNRLQRLVSTPKRYLIDSGVAAAVLRVEAEDVLRDGDLLGRVLDTFVAAQLRAEAEVSERRPRLFHLREEGGRHEVDLVADLGARGVVGIEVKASSAPTKAMAKHLLWLRDRLEDQFVAGILFHTGPRAVELDDRILALPIASIWS